MSLAREFGDEVSIQLPHIKLAGRLWGAADKPLILALHGWLDNANSFQPLSDYLTDYQILAIDWPGHGASEHRPGAYPLHWIDYLYDLDALLDVLSINQRPVALLGHSLGGIIASAYSAAFPNKVENLILIEALAPLYEDEVKAKKRLDNSFRGHRRFLASMAKPVSVYRDMAVAVQARHKLTALELQWCELLTQRNMQTLDSGVCWRSDPRLKLDSPLRLTFSQVDALMQAHKVNTLLISGSGGFSQLREAIPMANRWFERLKSVKVEGDHHLHMGGAEEVSNLIRDFLKT
ncbi:MULTISPECIES: alpha/beta fold hydrolase [unclassified Shewanella]|uniref:alpha/beta fold hydrolase n=1 Tax=unclassified Shewanella TaxID=196818 RepID=UPI001BC407F9|nr:MULTISPECIES: alpha/beta hydrolase [unclassified Shewanella]MCG9730662.1 alpha/beta fold hydrolase [Shewanella sp. Isolate13]GIU14447.1 alpha/beta hydrolase [Shewanella sp. MBTL60-007]